MNAQSQQFVVRVGDTLKLGGRPFYFLGTNAYYLLEEAARGDTATVKALFSTAKNLGMTVVRTWGFFDSSDSLNPAVIQYRPGAFNEHALRSLDYVVYQAGLNNIRLLIPLVNSWDDYGGMNQYVRWRLEYPLLDKEEEVYSAEDLQRVVAGSGGRSYRVALTSQLGHDRFYSDSLIRSWYRAYVSTILQRVNIYTGISYKDDPFIFGWELANEPRSSDRSGGIVARWSEEISRHIKSVDPNHLVGTGEEGFDVMAAPYSNSLYNNQRWLFDGTAGVSFLANSAIHSIDFASIHLYPESWNLPNSRGNVWIRDHTRLAAALNKPLVLGEFGVRTLKAQTYESWLTTVLLDGASGGIVWQVLEGSRGDAEGFGFRCFEEQFVCSTLRNSAAQFSLKSQTGVLPPPASFSLRQNYPNPFNGQTTISYTLPTASHVTLAVFSTAGEQVATLVDEVQQAGERKELFDARTLASGVYFYRVEAGPSAGAGPGHRATMKLLLLK